jgi:hypothetical protein
MTNPFLPMGNGDIVEWQVPEGEQAHGVQRLYPLICNEATS